MRKEEGGAWARTERKLGCEKCKEKERLRARVRCGGRGIDLGIPVAKVETKKEKLCCG